MKKLVIFGFDGTIADTAPGILYCFNTTAMAMGFKPVDHSALFKIFNKRLEDRFKELCGMTNDESIYAAKNYSKLYSQKGKEMYLLYDGLLESLKELKKDGCKLAIATLKHNMYTLDILHACGIFDLFDTICATDVDKETTKSDLLLQVCEKTGVSIADSVMIGDSSADAEGAKEIGMDFAAVLFGWGFKTAEDAQNYGAKAVIRTAGEIKSVISKL